MIESKEIKAVIVNSLVVPASHSLQPGAVYEDLKPGNVNIFLTEVAKIPNDYILISLTSLSVKSLNVVSRGMLNDKQVLVFHYKHYLKIVNKPRNKGEPNTCTILART